MPLSLNNLQAPEKDANKRSWRIGRGNSSGTGAYSGKGIKGQKARTGGGKGLKMRALRKRLMSVPKLKGFSAIMGKAAVVNVLQLEAAFESGAVVSPKSLMKKGLIETPRYGVKILGSGTISKALIVRKCLVSRAAKEKIEQTGGKVE